MVEVYEDCIVIEQLDPATETPMRITLSLQQSRDLAAALNPLRHWPIVLVGLLGKLFGPIGFVDAALIKGTFPVQFGWTIITNDLIWWIPFAVILLAAWRAGEMGRRP